MYANSRFKKSVNEWGRVEEWIEPGQEISQSDIGVSDDDWKGLIDSGAVVESYPENLNPQTPPAEYYRQNPDEAPESKLTAESPSADVMAAGDAGQPLPTGDEGNKGSKEEDKKSWQK